MNDNSFEKDMKDSFHQYEPNLNTDEIWENIEPKLKKKKKRRFFFWLWFGILGVISTIAILVFFPKKNNVEIDGLKIENISEYNNNQPNETTLTNNTQDLEEVLSQQDKVEQTTQAATVEQKTKQREKTSIVNVNPFDNRQEEVVFESSSVSTSIQQTPPLSNSATIENKLINLTMVDEASVNANTTTEATIVLENPKENEAVEEEEEQSVRSEKPSETLLLAEEKKKTQKEKTSKQKSEKSEKNKKSKKKVTRKKRPKWHYESQFTIAPILPIKAMSANPDVSFASQTLDLRREKEKQLEAFGFKGSLVFQHRKGFLLTGGIEYQQLNERFKNQETVTEIIQEVVTLTVTENQNEEIINSTSGPLYVTQTTTVNQRIANNYRFINIPIGVGMAWTKRKQHYKLVGGLDYNLFFRFKGALIRNYDGEQSTEIFKKNDHNSSSYNSIFKDRVGFGLWIAGEYHRPINNKLSWILAPKIQIPFSTISQDLTGVNQRYYRISLETGVNYWLNPVKKKRRF